MSAVYCAIWIIPTNNGSMTHFHFWCTAVVFWGQYWCINAKVMSIRLVEKTVTNLNYQLDARNDHDLEVVTLKPTNFNVIKYFGPVKEIAKYFYIS
jgi:hypothetical protein